MDRRKFVGRSAGLLGATAIGPSLAATAIAEAQSGAGPIASLQPLGPPVMPITDDERRARIEKARRLMTENGIGAMFLEGGTSMFYFTGVRWGNSERTFGVVIPAKGELAWVTPAFEEAARARADQVLERRARLAGGRESVQGDRADPPRPRRRRPARSAWRSASASSSSTACDRNCRSAQFVSATPVTAGCRMIKSPAEIALMQRANDITLAGDRRVVQDAEGRHDAAGAVGERRRGDAQARRRRRWRARHLRQVHGVPAWQHSAAEAAARATSCLIDAGCTVDGYTSDITRTTVFGKPTQRMRDVWEIEKRAQSAAFAAAQIGATCESVDAAARKVITAAGFGPDYKVPGLPHRTGHGIGLDGHEWTNFVRGNTTKIQPGMCFSDEPTIVIYGEFGIRLEDCLHITETGPKILHAAEPVDREAVSVAAAERAYVPRRRHSRRSLAYVESMRRT